MPTRCKGRGNAFTPMAVWVTENLVPKPPDIYDFSKNAAECDRSHPSLKIFFFFPSQEAFGENGGEAREWVIDSILLLKIRSQINCYDKSRKHLFSREIFFLMNGWHRASPRNARSLRSRGQTLSLGCLEGQGHA